MVRHLPEGGTLETEMYLEDGKKVPDTLESLADKRQWLVERLEKYESEIIEHVRDEYLKGASARNIAKRAGVTHPTVLKWLRRASVDGGDATLPDGH
jgi:DNA-directed RNA polymerase specialized sigma24 family protein